MSTVNGFQVGSETLKYNYESLDNYNTPNFSTSSSKTYAVGDYVMYNGKLYKCTTATTGGTWVSGSWTLVVLSDDVSNLSRQISDFGENVMINTHDSADWAQGYWAVADGTIFSSGSWCRSNMNLEESVTTIKSEGTVKIFLLAYENDNYIGTWFGNGFSKTYNAQYVIHEINLTDFRKRFPTYTFRLDATMIASDTILTPVMASNLVTITKSLATIQNNELKIINGNINSPVFWENGTINSDGAPGADDEIFYKRIFTRQKIRAIFPITITPKSGYAFSVTTYSSEGVFESQFTAWSEVPYTFSNPNKLYRVVVKAVDNSTVLPVNVSNYIDAKLLYSIPFNRMLSECANVKAVNHRGYNVVAPENTLPAFGLSYQYGYKFVETDVLFTSDGVPVLMHDDTIDRTCCNASDGSAVTGNVAVESISYNDLITNYDACTPSQWSVWAGTKVPTFTEFIRVCKAYNLHPWIELKWTHTYTLSEVQQIISIIRQNGMEENVSFISFSYDALALVASEWDTVELGLNGSVANAESLKTGKNRVFMIYNYSTSDYTEAVNAGLQICFYTVNTESALASIGTYAYDSILTNGLLPTQVCDVVRNKIDLGS